MRRAVQSALGPVLQDMAAAAQQMSRSLANVDTRSLQTGMQNTANAAQNAAQQVSGIAGAARTASNGLSRIDSAALTQIVRNADGASDALQQLDRFQLDALLQAARRAGNSIGEAIPAGASHAERSIGNLNAADLTRLISQTEEARRNLGRVSTEADQTADSVAEVGTATQEAGQKGESGGLFKFDFKEMAAGAAGAALAVAGIGTALETIQEAISRQSQGNKLTAQLGLSPEEAEKAGKIAGDVYSNNFGESFEQVNEGVAAVVSSLGNLTDDSPAAIQKMTEAALTLSDTFGIDVAESAQSANNLIRNGLAKDGPEAFDLIAAAMQKVPVQMRDEVLPILDEYSTNLNSIGLSGPEALGLVVNAAQSGAIAMDKAGDAIKEFGIRATDIGDTGAQDAIKSLGFDSIQMSKDLLAGGDIANAAFNKIVTGLTNIQDPAQQAATSVALFGTPLEDLDKAKIPGFLAGLKDGASSMGDFVGTTDRMSEALGQGFAPKLEQFRRQVQEKLIDGLNIAVNFINEKAIPAVKDFADTFLETDFGSAIKDAFSGGDNLLEGLADSVREGAKKLPGIVVDFIQEIPSHVEEFIRNIDWGNVAQALYEGVKKFITSGGVLIIPAIIALPVAIAAAFLAAMLAAALGIAKALGDMFMDNVWPFLQELPDKAVEFLGDLATPVIEWFVKQWAAFTATVGGTIDTVMTFFTELPGKVLGWLGDLGGAIGGWFSEQWTNFTTGLGATIDVASTFFSALPGKIVGWIGDLAGALGVWFSEQWNNFTAALGAILDTISAPFEKVSGFIQSALSNVSGFFSSTVEGIRGVWDGLKEVVAAPIRFFVDTVYTGGIAKAWNAVAGFIPGLGNAPEIHFGAADGAVLPGWTPGRDVHKFYSPTGGRLDLSGGEAVMRPEFTQALGPTRVNEVNRLAKHGGVSAVRGALGLRDGGVIGFSEGGIIDSIVGLIHKYFPGMQIGSTWRDEPGSYHNVGMAVDTSNNDNFALMDKVATFFYQNFGGQLAELIHWPLNGWENIKDGHPLNYGDKTNNEHRDHVHIANKTPLPDPGTGEIFAGTEIQGALEGNRSGGLVSTVRSFVADRARGILDSILGPIRDLIPTGNSVFEKIPLGIFDALKEKVYSFIGAKGKEVDASIISGHGAVGAGVERYRPLVEQLLHVYGLATELANSTLRRMNQESGGVPDIVNTWDSNWLAGTPSVGLMQVIGPTYAANKDPQFDAGPYLYGVSVDPAANISSSMRYALRQYGSLSSAYDRAGGYDEGGIANGKGVMLKNTISPERVLSPEQTKMFEALVAALQSLSTTGSSAITSIFDSIGTSVGGVIRDLVNASITPVEKKKDEDPVPTDTTFLAKTQNTLDKQDQLLSDTQDLAVRSQSSQSMARQKELDLLKEQLTDVANKLTAGVLGPVVESAFDNALDVAQKWLGAGFTEVVDGTDRTTQAVQQDNASTTTAAKSTPAFGEPGSAFDAASVISSAVVSVANTASSAIMAVGQDIAKAALAQTGSKVTQSAGVLGKDVSGGFLVDMLVRLTGVEIQIRDTLTASADEARKFRGDQFKGFDETGQLLSDTAGLIERSETSQATALSEQNRINQALIKALLKYLMLAVVIPVLTAVLGAMITVATTAIGAAIGSFIPVIGTAIGAAVGALVGVGLTALAAGFIATAATGVGAALDSFDQGGIAPGVGFMPKNTIAPERVLSPKQTADFGRMVDALEKGTNRTQINAPFTVVGDRRGGEIVRNRLLGKLNS